MPTALSAGDFGVAMSGVLELNPWVTDYVGAFAALRASGCKRTSVPTDQNSDLTKLQPVLKAAHQAGFTGIHVSPHNDAGGGDTANWPNVDFAGYSAWFDTVCQACRNADGSTYATSMELWNEAEYNVAGDYWTPAVTLYGNAHTLAASCATWIPTAKVIMPVALDQSLEKCIDMQGYSAITSAIHSVAPYAMGVHAYTTSNPENGVVDLDGRLAYAKSLASFLGIPVMFTEYGGSSAGLPCGNIFKGIAAWLRENGYTGTAWQWYDSSGLDGLQLKGQDVIMDAMGTFRYSTAWGKSIGTRS